MTPSSVGFDPSDKIKGDADVAIIKQPDAISTAAQVMPVCMFQRLFVDGLPVDASMLLLINQSLLFSIQLTAQLRPEIKPVPLVPVI